jgi:transcription antitermination factor NusG
MPDKAHWYAIYTKPRSEKKLTDRLTKKGIEAYLPLRKTLKQWSDRKKRVEEPLISSYVFVNILPSNYFEVLNTPGAVRYIWFSGKPASIPDKQIQVLKLIAGGDIESEAVPFRLPKGSQVRITSGPLRELTGELVNFAGNHRVIVRIDHIDKALLLTISPHLLEPIVIN